MSEPFNTYDDWRRWRDTQRATQAEPGCDLCHGTGWTSFPDPYFGGALIDGRCPACCDTTIRARKSRWEDGHGRKVGPK